MKDKPPPFLGPRGGDLRWWNRAAILATLDILADPSGEVQIVAGDRDQARKVFEVVQALVDEHPGHPGEDHCGACVDERNLGYARPVLFTINDAKPPCCCRDTRAEADAR